MATDPPTRLQYHLQQFGQHDLVFVESTRLVSGTVEKHHRAGGFMSDGMQLLELSRGGAAVTERQVLVRLMGVSYAGVRPRDWDPQLVHDALHLQSSEPPRRVAGRLFAFYHAMDRGDVQQLHEHADWLAARLGDYPDGFRQSITLELCLVAAQRGDLAAARQWWRRSRGGVVDTARRALVALEQGGGLQPLGTVG